jgi:phosphoserine phosphatase
MTAVPSLKGAADPLPVSRVIRVTLMIPDRFTRALYRGYLDEAGYAVTEVEGPSGVLASDAPEPADVIILDAAEQHAEVVGLIQGLKGNPPTQDIPVLALVAEGDEVGIADLTTSAVDDCLVKPARQWELLIRVRGLIRLGQHRRELLNGRSLHGEQTRTWEVLVEFTRSVARSESLDTLLDEILHAATVMTSSRRVSLMLPDDDGTHLTIARSVGLDPAYSSGAKVPIGQAISGRAFRSGRAVTTLDDHEELAQRDGFGFRSFVSMPMIYTTMSMVHQRVGVINISNRYGDRPFEEWELEFIDLLGSIAGSAIDDIHSRQTHEALLRMERDLQVARKIQRSTFPKRLPALHGFEIDAWSEPAEQTAGDTYDVIGYCSDGNGGVARFSDDDPDRAILLLADATGHGIGPALSVTQVRSMLRMAVRMQVDLARIAGHMNEQLCADLPGGRFVTTWLGDLNARDGALNSLSAGQAPILHYHADRDAFDIRPADTMPLGILSSLEIPVTEPIWMAPGDIVAVLSDGLIEAADADRQQFGIDRTMQVLAANHDRNPTRIRTALRRAVAELTGSIPAADDRTAIIIKRTAVSPPKAA